MILATSSIIAQRKITPTEYFTINGKIKIEQVFDLAQLDRFPKIQIDNQIIYNHKGEAKDTLKNIKGVLLTTVLSKIEFIYEKPKNLNEFYFVCVASDGYKAVFSWNEIYNSEIGNHLYVITEMGGTSIKQLSQRIQVISTADLKSGRRYIKALQRIEVNQAK